MMWLCSGLFSIYKTSVFKLVHFFPVTIDAGECQNSKQLFNANRGAHPETQRRDKGWLMMWQRFFLHEGKAFSNQKIPFQNEATELMRANRIEFAKRFERVATIAKKNTEEIKSEINEIGYKLDQTFSVKTLSFCCWNPSSLHLFHWHIPL